MTPRINRLAPATSAAFAARFATSAALVARSAAPATRFAALTALAAFLAATTLAPVTLAQTTTTTLAPAAPAALAPAALAQTTTTTTTTTTTATPPPPDAPAASAPMFLSPPSAHYSEEIPVVTPALVPSGNPNERMAFNWTALPLSMAIPEIEKLTGRTIIRPATLPNVADLSLTFATPPTRAEALQAIETLFTINQLAIIPRGEKLLMLVPLNSVRSEAPVIIEGSTLALPPSGRIASKFFRLEFLRIVEFAPTLSMMLNAQIQTISLYERANAMLITDSISTLQRIETIIRQVDRPAPSPVQAKFYSLEYAKASDIVNKIKAIFVGPLQQQLGLSTTFNSDDRTNQVIVIADPRQLSFFDDLIKKLDVKADPNTRNEVIRLRSADCTAMATLLAGVISGQVRAAQAAQGVGGASVGQRPITGQTAGQRQLNTTTQSANQARNAAGGRGATTQQAGAGGAAQQRAGAGGSVPSFATPAGNVSATSLGLEGNEFSSFITVQPDTRINAVVVSGTVDDIRIIKDLIEQLDVLLAQVRIEVVIAEVSLSDEATSGIDALGLNVEGGKLTGIVSAGAGYSFGSNVGTSGTASTFVSALQPLTGVISLSTTPRKNNTNIVSVPAITTMHNKEGKIFIGETRPVITASTTDYATTNARTSSVTQMEIGTTITVTPLIGYDGTVQLDIQQEISDVSGEVKIDENTQYVIGKRNTSSSVIIKSGEIIVLGGIQKNSASKTTSRLGPIPIIGDLLGSRKRSQNRTELIFFLRPTVLTNTDADTAPAMEQLDRMSNKEAVQKVLGQTPAPPGGNADELPALPAAPSRKKKRG